jgi:hypothetical protein
VSELSMTGLSGEPMKGECGVALLKESRLRWKRVVKSGETRGG